MLRVDDDEIWEWYQIILKYQCQDLGPQAFCEQNHLNYHKFSGKLFRIIYKRDREPKLYQKWLLITREYMKAPGHPSKFIKNHDIPLRQLGEMVTHLNYLDAIEEIRKRKEPNSMEFVKVPTMNLPFIHPKEPEVVKKQNDVELIISAGVKVVVSPEVGADKLIRIIELLKDL